MNCTTGRPTARSYVPPPAAATRRRSSRDATAAPEAERWEERATAGMPVAGRRRGDGLSAREAPSHRSPLRGGASRRQPLPEWNSDFVEDRALEQAPPQCNTRTCGRPRGGSAERGGGAGASYRGDTEPPARNGHHRDPPRAQSGQRARTPQWFNDFDGPHPTHGDAYGDPYYDEEPAHRAPPEDRDASPYVAKDERPLPRPGQSMREMEAAAADEGPSALVQCEMCGRSFGADRIDKHRAVCGGAAAKPRKAFNAARQRLGGLDNVDVRQAAADERRRWEDRGGPLARPARRGCARHLRTSRDCPRDAAHRTTATAVLAAGYRQSAHGRDPPLSAASAPPRPAK